MSVDINTYTEDMLTKTALVQASISTVGNLQDATPVVLQTVYSAVQDLTVPFNNAIAAYDADIDTTTFGGVDPVLAAPSMSLALLEQATDSEQLAILIVGLAYVTRVGTNILNATG